MADLLVEAMVTSNHPFSSTGIEFFELFYVPTGRSTEKRQGFVFTWLATMAVHVEIELSLDTSSCEKRMDRFTAQYT